MVLKLSHSIGLIVVVLAMCAATSSIAGNTKETAATDKNAAMLEQVAKKLSVDSLWTDAGKKEELLRLLNVAKQLRICQAAPILAPRIAHDPNPGAIEKRPRPTGIKHPVYGALAAIGIPAVPAMLDELKKTNPKDNEESRLKHVLILFCICDIYEQGITDAVKAGPDFQIGAHGNVMAKKRLELELSVTKDAIQKSNLRTALQHPVFRTR